MLSDEPFDSFSVELVDVFVVFPDDSFVVFSSNVFSEVVVLFSSFSATSFESVSVLVVCSLIILAAVVILLFCDTVVPSPNWP